MFALLRQLSKLLLLVFNLPQVLQLLTQLFSVQEKDGKLELGVVNVIAQTLAQQEVAELTQDIETGKETRRQEIEEETEELIASYDSMDEESKEYFTQQAQARRRRVLQDIRNTKTEDILTDDFLQQSIEAKKKQLEPSIVPSLTPITSLLGIPVMALKLQEYIPGFSAPSVTDQETANEAAEGFTGDFPAGGDIFDGPVGEGELAVEFKGATNEQDFYLYVTPEDRDYLTLYVSQPATPIRAYVTDSGGLTNDLLDEMLTIEVSPHSNPVVNLQLDRVELGSGLVRAAQISAFKRNGADEETEIVLRIEDRVGDTTDITIPILISTEVPE